MSAVRLQIENVNKTFWRAGKPPVEALRGIELSIEEGEFDSIVGASGSGKSTLLRIIDGLLEPTDGQIYLNGGAVNRPDRDRAMVFQQDALLPWNTVIENVAYGLTLARIPKAQAHATAHRPRWTAGLRASLPTPTVGRYAPACQRCARPGSRSHNPTP